MATKKQIEANRLNATKSTGPRTPEGKSRSRMNALKSGIDAKAQIIRDEKAANLEALKTDYYDRYHPTTPVQRMLVDTLVDAEWLLRRFRVCEAQLWEEGVDMPLRPDEGVELGQAFRFQCDYFVRLQRRLDSLHRNYRNALHELERLQAGENSDPHPDPVTPPIQTPKRQNGFVPQTTLPSDLTHSKPPLPAANSPLDTENSIT